MLCELGAILRQRDADELGAVEREEPALRVEGEAARTFHRQSSQHFALERVDKDQGAELVHARHEQAVADRDAADLVDPMIIALLTRGRRERMLEDWPVALRHQ